MASVSTWTSPEIDARIIALKQAGLSHAQIAREIVADFRVFVNKNMVLRRARTILGIDRGEKAANERLEAKRKAEKAALEPKAPKTRPMAMPPDDYPLSAHPKNRTVLIYAAEDELFEPDWERFMARELLGVEPIEIPGGHFPMAEDPDALAEVLDHLARG